MNLVLDLDETLISVKLEPFKDFDFKFKIQGTLFYCKKRPSLDLFLKYVFKHFDTVNIWTAATAEYARKIINNIMSREQISKMTFIKTRKDLSYDHQGKIYKPLEKIFIDPIARSNNINKKNTIMIDDKVDFMIDNLGNSIIIPAFRGQDKDRYLPKLLIVLDGILSYNIDFSILRETLDLRKIVE